MDISNETGIGRNMTVITDIKQVLRKRSKGWQIVTDDFVLKEFLSGDYDIWVRRGNQ